MCRVLEGGECGGGGAFCVASLLLFTEVEKCKVRSRGLEEVLTEHREKPTDP